MRIGAGLGLDPIDNFQLLAESRHRANYAERVAGSTLLPSASGPRRAQFSRRYCRTYNDMLLLRSALEAIATALETSTSTSAMVADLERALCRAICPGRVTIALASEATAAGDKAIALRLDGHIVGTMLAESVPPSLESEVNDSLQLLAAPIAAAIAYRQRPERRRREAGTEDIDSLCRIPNRRAFDERLREAWERAGARKTALVMALVDVDYFKTYNDRYGHIAGDGCLQQVASLLVKRRGGDDGFAARYGGEEFVLIFEETPRERAIDEVQHIFERLAALQLEHAGTTLGRISLSAGISALIPTRERTTIELIEEADRALYQAKRLGRNRICAGSFVSKGAVVAKLSGPKRSFAAANAPSFGRDDDVARIMSALHHGRMLTIVGPRGIGKSRLLTLIANQAMNRLHRSVVFVESELLRADMDPATALASACDLTIEPGGALDAVTDFLADREAIVILDDVEPARAQIRSICSHLCARTSSVSIVAAADAPLGIPGERTIVVPPLDDDASLALLTVHWGGNLAAADTAAARGIVRHLGGNPATIETAGEWIHRVGIDAVHNRLAALGGVYTNPAELTALLSTTPLGT